jgi:site-specific DNA-methyltransferase (adenine-specific)
MRDGWTMEHGNAVELMRSLPDCSVDGIITDPPYGSGGDTASERMRSSKTKYVSSDASYQSTLPGIDGDAIHPEEWTEMMRQWLAQCRRVLTDGGVFATFIDWRNGPSLMRLIMASGIRLRGMAVWDKGPAARPYPGGFRMQSEYILWGGVGKLPNQNLYLPGVLHHTTKIRGKVHITEKPLALMRDLVKIARPGGVILDPFAGSSTTGVAAIEEGYTYHGMESVEAYFEVSVQRLAEASNGQT